MTAPRTWPASPTVLAGLIAEHAAADRAVGVLLVRLGGFAAGVFAGSPPRLVSSKTGSRLVYGRSAAGGTSQQRFARRRENQAASALAAAADTAERWPGESAAPGLVVMPGAVRERASLSTWPGAGVFHPLRLPGNPDRYGETGGLGHLTVSCREPGCRSVWYTPPHESGTEAWPLSGQAARSVAV
jgi:hypothetical protein